MDSNNMYNQTTEQGGHQPEQGSYQPQQGNYQPQQGNYQPELEAPVTMGEWLITMLIICIPCVNIVMMFVWAFSKAEKKSKSNFFKAQLIVAAIMFALSFVLIIIGGASVASIVGGGL